MKEIKAIVEILAKHGPDWIERGAKSHRAHSGLIMFLCAGVIAWLYRDDPGSNSLLAVGILALLGAVLWAGDVWLQSGKPGPETGLEAKAEAPESPDEQLPTIDGRASEKPSRPESHPSGSSRLWARMIATLVVFLIGGGLTVVLSSFLGPRDGCIDPDKEMLRMVEQSYAGDPTALPEIARRMRRWDLRGKDLSGRNLYNVDLIDACLRGAKLVGANLKTANLTGADLRGANLMDARLNGATLTNARMDEKTNLSGADLDGATLPTEGIRRAIVKGLLYDGRTKLDTGLDPAAELDRRGAKRR